MAIHVPLLAVAKYTHMFANDSKTSFEKYPARLSWTVIVAGAGDREDDYVGSRVRRGSMSPW
jgi:hypothetical protein